MGVSLAILLILFFYIMFRMIQLSLKIEHLRIGKSESIWWVLARPINMHLWPGPILSEQDDTEETKETIRKRNRWVGLFWVLVALTAIVAFFVAKNEGATN